MTKADPQPNSPASHIKPRGTKRVSRAHDAASATPTNDLFAACVPDATPSSADRGAGPHKTYSPLRPDGQFGCAICGAPAHFGFDVRLLSGKLGRWACRDHRDAVKNRASPTALNNLDKT